MSLEVHEIRIDHAEKALDELAGDVRENKKSILDIERQLRDARLLLTFFGAVALVGGAFVTFAYTKVMGARALQKELIGDIQNTGALQMQALKASADKEIKSIRIEATAIATKQSTASVQQLLSGYDSRITRATAGPSAFSRMNKPQTISSRRDVSVRFDQSPYDTAGAVAVGDDGWRYYAKQPGLYHVAVTLAFTEPNYGYATLTLRKNATKYAAMGGYIFCHGQQYVVPLHGGADVPLKAGDFVDVSLFQEMADNGSRTIGNDPAQNWVTVAFVRDVP